MPHYKYLIIGGGMTGDAAINGIREIDSSGDIGVIGADSHRPYNRPPLSKSLWKGKPLDSIWRNSDARGVTFHLGRKVSRLDLPNKRAIDDQEAVYTFDKLLLATGCRPRRLQMADDGIIYYRTLDDYQRLRGLAERGRRFAVIGGGFIGAEIAAALAMTGNEVTLAFRGEYIGDRMFPRELGLFLNDYYRQKNVDVVASAEIAGVATQQGASMVQIRSTPDGRGRDIKVDGIVAGIGVVPNVELATAAGLMVENGIRVDSSLHTSHPDVFAAGDVANFYNPALDRRLRVEHEDNANTMGKLAGRAMAGAEVDYTYLPSFYSDLFDLGYEAVGDVNSQLQTVADWKEPCREGVVYYLEENRVRGVLLWNVWDQVDAARKLIAEPGPKRDVDLKGRLPA